MDLRTTYICTNLMGCDKYLVKYMSFLQRRAIYATYNISSYELMISVIIWFQ